MMRLALFAAAGLALAGCKNDTEAKPSPPAGSAMTSGSGSESTGSAAATAAKPVTQEDIAKRFDDCWKERELAKWDAVQACYTSDASYDAPGSGTATITGSASIAAQMQAHRAGFPDEKGQVQLVLVNGHKAVAIVLLTGKNTGPMKTPTGESPATGKPIGLYIGQVLAFDDTGKITHESDYQDDATLQHQLKPDKDHPPRAVIEKLEVPAQTALAKDDATERANLGTAKQFIEEFNKHDGKALAGLMTDDAMWLDLSQPKDLRKKQVTSHLEQLWKGFSDLKISVIDSIAAGDYVATTATFEGTNDGDLPMMHVKKTGKKVSVPFLLVEQFANGKMKSTWLLRQSKSLASQLGTPRAKK
ncbi:MAG TPA: nuclear transport factor 2 family protein [Kofleriaceae bacterium]